MMLRVFLLIALVLVAYMAPLWLFLIGMAGYAFFWKGYELLLVAVCIDIQFGFGGIFGYTYTILTGIIILGITMIKPNLRLR